MPVEEQGVSLAGRRFWVVGCGFLGAALLAALRAAGARCLGIDPVAPADVAGDAGDEAVLGAARRRLEPEFIFCCVATHGGDEAAYRRAYLDLPRALAFRMPGARLLLCSSSSVYGGLGGGRVTEATPRCPQSATARVLAEAEDAVLGQGGCVARLVPLYAEGRCELLRRHFDREPELPGAEERWLNYVHRDDAAAALTLLAGHLLRGSCPPCVNICGDSFTKGDAYTRLVALTGQPRVGRAAESRRRARLDQQVDATLLRGLGWRPQFAFFDWAELFLEIFDLSS